MSTRREWTVVFGVSLVWVLFLLTFALITPPFGAPDEPAHIDAVFRMAQGLGWPPAGEMHYLAAVRQIVEHPVPSVERVTVSTLLETVPGDSPAIDQSSQHPPTYYAVAATVLRALHWSAHSWGSSVLALRLFDILMVAALPVLVWATVRRATGSARIALVSPMLLFAAPQLGQVLSGVTVWAPMVLFGALTTWLSVRLLTGDRSWWTAAGLALVVAAGAGTTALGLVAVPFAVGVALLSPSVSRIARWGRAAVLLAVPLCATGWWWIRTITVSGTLVPDALRGSTQVEPYPPGGANVGSFAGRQWDGLTQSFFGLLGANQWTLPPVLIDGMAITALIAIVWTYSRPSADRRLLTVVLTWPALVLIASLVYNWRNYLGTHQGNGLQGRFLFVAIVALVLSQALAWRALIVRPHLRARLARLAVVAALVIAACGLTVSYRGAWENSQFRVTAAGLEALGGGSLAGPKPVALVGVLLVATAVTIAFVLWRLVAPTARPGLPTPERPVGFPPGSRANPTQDTPGDRPQNDWKETS